jgi:hypothetical protein
MVDETDKRLMNVPFVPLGLALEIAFTKARRLSANFASSKLALPTPACITPAF